MENIMNQLKIKTSDDIQSNNDVSQKFNELEQMMVQDKDELTTQYLIQMRERNIYFEKLKFIQTYAEEQNWNDDQNILMKIKDLLLNYRK